MILNNTVLLKRKPTEQMKIDEKKNTINHRSNLKINNDNIQIKQSMNLKAKKLLEKDVMMRQIFDKVRANLQLY